MVSESSEPAATLAEIPDSEVLRAIAQGDEAALATLFDRYAPLLGALSRRILGSSQDAEEVVQEAFLHVWKRAAQYDSSKSSVSTWLVLVARSRAIDRLRNRWVVERTVAQAAVSDPTPSHTSGEGPRRVLHEERRNRVRRELGALPAEQREVLELAFYEGLTQREIADQTGIPLGTVKTRTLLAMKKLRTVLRTQIRELL